MKASTLSARLSKRYTGSKSTIAYRIVNDIISGSNKSFAIRPDGTIRPCYTSGSGRFTSNQDHTADTKALLDLVGLKYTSGNDAPRGGATGQWIRISTKIERTSADL